MGRVPELRFPEFMEEWSKQYLKNLLKQLIDCEHKTAPYVDDSNYLVVRTNNVKNGKLVYDDIKYTTQEGFKEWTKRKKPSYGDILLTREAPAGELCLVPKNKNICLGQRMVLLQPNVDKVNSSFLLYFFQTHTGKTNLQKFIIGTTVTRINIKDIYKIVCYIPQLKEQQKIADFLTAIDEKITLTTDKISQLETYKREMMQKLLSGELRFPGFSGEWREVKLGEISDIATGKSNREDSTENDGEYTFFDRSEDIRTSSQYLFDGEAVIIAGEGQRFLPKYFIGKFDLHQRTYAIMNFHNAIGKYIFYYLSYFGNRYFLSQAVGTTVKSLRLPMFKKMEMKLPPKKEQQKIADFLSSLDDKLIIEKEKLDQLKTYKQGLLQKMFV